MIRIVNLKSYVAVDNEVLVRVDRKSALGNPFKMNDESERDSVCDRYEAYFERMRVENDAFHKELGRIWKLARKTNVALGCWCAPRRCHAETIKRFIEQYL